MPSWDLLRRLRDGGRSDVPTGPLRSAAMNLQVETNGITSVHLTLAVVDYEHVREIAQGLVRADGITLTPLIFPSIEVITFRFTKNLDCDVPALSFGKYVSFTSQATARMVHIRRIPSPTLPPSPTYL